MAQYKTANYCIHCNERIKHNGQYWVRVKYNGEYQIICPKSDTLSHKPR